MDARQCLELANRDQVEPEQLYEYFAINVPTLIVLYQKSDAGKKPLLSKSNRPDHKFVVAFTDVEAARLVKVQFPQFLEMVEEPALPFLLKAYRSDAQGVLLNPALPSRLFIVKHHLLGMIREYAIQKLSQLPGAWVPTMDQNLLLAEYQKGSYTVAVYASEKDANLIVKRTGGVVVQQPWGVIMDRCRQLGAYAPFFHFGLPEQMMFTPYQIERILQGPKQGYVERKPISLPFMESIEQVAPTQEAMVSQTSQPEAPPKVQNQEEPASSEKVTVSPEVSQPSQVEVQSKPEQEVEASVQEDVPPTTESKGESKPIDSVSEVQESRRSTTSLPPDVAAGLKQLEKATIEGQGMANGWEVCRALAQLRRIWVIVDQEGNMVILAGQDQSPIVDFFTSEEYAQLLIDEAHRKNPKLPPMYPQLISTKKVFKALAPRQPIVWINRGSPIAWTSVMGDTLPYVLQLKTQLEQAKETQEKA